MISELCQLLGSATSNAKHIYIWEWERDLGVELSMAQLAHLYQLTHFCSIGSRTQETIYNLLSHWY